MSKAKELAWYCGATFDEEAKLFVFDEEELRGFYHKARAEALREAADKWLIVSARELRAMADREGKE